MLQNITWDAPRHYIECPGTILVLFWDILEQYGVWGPFISMANKFHSQIPETWIFYIQIPRI